MSGRTLKRGYLITVEGIDGAGKSTQVARLAALLGSRGYDTLVTHEPGATPLGREVRRLLLDSTLTLTPEAELLLFLADRVEHVERVIGPALAAGTIVLSDRFSDSTVAYQGYGREADLARIQRWDAESRGRIAADLTLLLDCPVAEAARRRRGNDRYSALDFAFHGRVRDGFLALAAAAPGRVRVVDASRDLETVAGELAVLTLAWLAERTDACA